IYGIVYWGFGFLRMSTAGLAAQSDGQNDPLAVRLHLLRAVPSGLLLGLIVWAMQIWILPLVFTIYTASETIESAATIYISARLWGLPATLGSMAVMGWFVGISRSQYALILQIVLNVVNAFLSLYFVIRLDWGLYGVGIASAVAEWAGLGTGLWLASREFRRRAHGDNMFPGVSNFFDLPALQKLGVTHSNIFIRTLALTFGFNFFANAAATEGEVFLAANHIHLQFITMGALVLDAFAHTAEAVTGAAYGARNRMRFDRAVKLTTQYSAGFAILFGLIILLAGPWVIDILSIDPAVRDMGRIYLPYCALVPVFGFAAWQLDGIFIGTTRTREMRDAGIIAVLIYLAAHFVLQPGLGGTGIWVAFLIYYVARALTLAVYVPSIRRSLQPPPRN
ncbi:MAG: MATE family efflux transporter, partial [Hyphomonadaceae bacterium]|nr:MATE family efflux transporter [Hyphomonadaceae bacterium]